MHRSVKMVDDALETLDDVTIRALTTHYEAGVVSERERIIKLLEEMPWQIYQGVAHDGRILNLPTPKVLERETAIALIKGENK